MSKGFFESLFRKNKPIDDGEEGSDGAGKKAADNLSGLKKFRYTYDGTIGGGNCRAELIEKDGVWILEYENIDDRNYGVMRKQVDVSLADRLNEICLSLRLAEWDGFSKYNKYVCDGSGFSVSFRFRDGGTIEASGTNAFPERYGLFSQSMRECLDPYIEEMREEARRKIVAEGLPGSVTSVLAVFRQRGKAGSDSYDILVSRSGVRDVNFSFRANAPSGEFFASKAVDVALRIPDEEIPFDGIKALVDKYGLAEWYGFDRAAEDPDNAEWFQICFSFDDGKRMEAIGTAHPEGYDGFRTEFLRLLAAVAEKKIILRITD